MAAKLRSSSSSQSSSVATSDNPAEDNSTQSAAGKALAAVSLGMSYHPVVGYNWSPQRTMLPRPDGGTFELRVNSAGIRSNHDYTLEKPKGIYRILVFGCSQSGLYQSNERRFSELIARRNPGLEILDFSLPGTGTDQQLLAFEAIGSKYEHDLVLLMPFLANIRRNMAEIAGAVEPGGRIRYNRKPWFELVTLPDNTEELRLHNVPVPREEVESPQATSLKRRSAIRDRAKNSLLLRRLHHAIAPFLSRVGYEPYPEYSSDDTAEWQLMAAIIRRFVRENGKSPFVIAPIVDSWYVRFPDGQGYSHRFSSLADDEIVHVIDMLPYFRKLGRRLGECYMERDAHFSDLGHEVLADAVEGELRRLSLLPPRGTPSAV
jgi:hypothetical protein